MLKEFGYFGSDFFCWEDVVFGKTTMINAVEKHNEATGMSMELSK